MTRLHHLNRSRSHRILWLLEEIGEPYEIVPYRRDATTGLAPPELERVHPLGKAPMLELDGRLIVESGAIVETLCERFAPGMIPEPGGEDHLRHRELMHFAEGSAMTPILLDLYVGRLGEAGAPLRPRIVSELDRHFRYLDGLVGPSGHFVGDGLSAADVMLSFPAEIAMRDPEGARRYPGLARFVETIRARPAYGRAAGKGAMDE